MSNLPIASSPNQEQAYWRQHLPQLPLLTLPTDRSFRTETEQQNWASLAFTLPEQLLETMMVLSQREQVTLFTIVLAAFQLLLARYSEQKDIAVQVSGREERLMFVVRTNLDESLTVRELLEQVNAAMAEAHAHAVPAVSLYEFPLQAALHYHTDTEAHQIPHGSPEAEAAMLPARLLDLSLVMTSTTLEGTLQFRADLFDLTTMQRLLGHYQVILENMVADPGQPCWQLPLLSPEERHQLLYEWNLTTTAYPKNQCIHQLFEAQVAHTPRAVAMLFQDRQLTYEELDEHANQLAHYLQRLGVGPEVLVGLCVERGPEMVIALLAILKAGGAYVPLDPTYPLDRLAFLIEDTHMAVLLTQTSLVKQLPTSQAQLICLDQIWEALTSESRDRLITDISADNLAYVIYTSGSTGKPKGVMIPHRGLLNYLNWSQRAYPVMGGGSPVHSSISFDLTITSLFVPLVVGQHVVLQAEQQGIESLSDAFKRQEHFSFVKLTPAHLELLSQQLSPAEALYGTGALIIGGEALHADQLTFWQMNAPDMRIINEYGPTEAVVGCCVYEIPHGTKQRKNVPIGRPIANTQVYILDRYLQPVPIGVAGELYIGGDGLARGYLKQPGLTAARFIPHPFSTIGGERLYKTGDLACYLPDGSIDFLGRLDYQIKLHGFRIETGEIETALDSHPAVRQSVVTMHEDSRRQKRLVAYFVPAQNQRPGIEDLRAHLQLRIPAYMIPATFMPLSELPLTSNGKVNRKALPAPEQATDSDVKGSYLRPDLSSAYVPPGNEVERTMVAIWEEYLHFCPIGIHDRFNELGGDSLLILQVISHLSNTFLVRLTIRDFLINPTIADLALLISQRLVEEFDRSRLEQLLVEFES